MTRTRALYSPVGTPVVWNHDAYGKRLTLHGHTTERGLTADTALAIEDSLGNHWLLDYTTVQLDGHA